MDTRTISFETFCFKQSEYTAESSRLPHETVSAKEMYGHLEAIRHILAGGRAKTAKRMIGTVDPTSE